MLSSGVQGCRLWAFGVGFTYSFLAQHLPAAEAMQNDKEVPLLGQLLKAEGTMAKAILSRVLCRAQEGSRDNNVKKKMPAKTPIRRSRPHLTRCRSRSKVYISKVHEQVCL